MPDSSRTVVDLLEAAVDAAGESEALAHRGSTLRYRELDERVNAIAHRVLALDLPRNSAVAVRLPRGIDAILGILGAVKAGAAAVYLDPALPPGRQEAILRAAEVRAVLLDRFGVFGVRTAITLLRRGIDDPAKLSAELVKRSGLDELREVLTQLIDDEANLETIPERTLLLEGLRDRGLGEFVEDLTSRRVPGHRVAEEFDLAWWQSSLEAMAADDGLLPMTDGSSLRRGLPVALGILWPHCARAAGWRAHGVDFPGHFLVALDGPTLPGAVQQTVLDPFSGGAALDARALRALLKRVEGADAELRPGVLQPMSARGVLLRLQNNLKVRRLRAGELASALACTQDMLRIAPDAAGLWREAAVMNQSLGRVAAALRCFEGFLHLVPEGEAAARVKVTMNELRARLN